MKRRTSILDKKLSYHAKYRNILRPSNQRKNRSATFDDRIAKSFSESCDRAGISDQSAALLPSALLKDINYVNQDDRSCVIDRSKVKNC